MHSRNLCFVKCENCVQQFYNSEKQWRVVVLRSPLSLSDLQQDNFYNYCLSESARRDQGLDSDRVRTSLLSVLLPVTGYLQGVFTGHDHQETDLSDMLVGLLGRLKEYSSAFSDGVQNIVQHLQVHPDLDCRFLAIRLSFADFYRRKEHPQNR